MRRALPLLLALMLGACVLPGADAPATGGLLGEPVTVTPLDDEPGAIASGAEPSDETEAPLLQLPEFLPEAAEAPEAEPGAVPGGASETAPEAVAEAVPEGEAAAEAAPEGEPEPEPEPEPALDPEPPLSAEARACQRRGGSWVRVIPGSDLRSCVRSMRDSGQRCDSGRDCAGECLARSGTCAPVDPLFGCHEILDDSGRAMTQCIN